MTNPCPHHTPNAGGAIASELHGVCIFCWRDRLGAKSREVAALRAERDALLARMGQLVALATIDHAGMHGGCDAYRSPFPYPGQEPPGDCTCGADDHNARVRALSRLPSDTGEPATKEKP